MKKLIKLLGTIAIVAVLAATALGASASAGSTAYGAATVDASLLNIRGGPGLSYEIVTTIGDNSIVVILERVNSEWYYINYNGTVGYAKTEYFKDVLSAENFSATGTVSAEAVLMRTSPTTDSRVLHTFDTNASLAVIGINDGWYKVKYDGDTGYIRSDLMKITAGYSSAAAASAKSSSATAATRSGGAPAPSSTGNALVDFALGYVGYNYVYGGSSPKTGFDCSGFSSYVFKNFGVTLTRNSAGQYKNDGVSVSKSELAPGDLLFFSSNGGASVTHVGIYMGDNEFVHASGSKVGVIVSRTDSTYYINHWVGAKRISF
ncbi:MAG: C40 family peptidase [Oscillospiraceae bacterium]|jgi:cell wall-associated NlpC family hydrolase|nr:C40 family peptidase [Oscillospiraceae bacterium]